MAFAVLKQFPKDPDEILDFVIDWTAWLGSDTISSSNFTVVTSGITKDSQTNDTKTATVRLSGGTAGNTYQVTNRIDTAAGLRAERTIEIQVDTR